MLSILIPTLPARYEMFKALSNKVNEQVTFCDTVHPTLGVVQILVNGEPSFRDGGPSIGEKRQRLLDAATGRYVCYLDDDEDIAPDYVETLLRLCNQGQDVCTFNSFVKVKDFWGLVKMDLNNPNDQMTDIGVTRRTPWHICPIRRVYAQASRFNNANAAEDSDWLSRVLPLCKTQAYVDKIIHIYNHGDHSESDKILRAK